MNIVSSYCLSSALNVRTCYIVLLLPRIASLRALGLRRDCDRCLVVADGQGVAR
jgi:hypothetical protein